MKDCKSVLGLMRLPFISLAPVRVLVGMGSGQNVSINVLTLARLAVGFCIH